MKHLPRTLTLLTLAALLFAGCAATADAGNTLGTNETTPPATTTAATTIDRNKLTNPDLSEIEVEIITAMWEKYNSRAESFLTINNISLDEFLEPCGDAYVLFVTDFMAPGAAMTKEKVADLEFRYINTRKLSVYSSGEFYSLKQAYDSNVISQDELRAVWEVYRVKASYLYESYEAEDFMG